MATRKVSAIADELNTVVEAASANLRLLPDADASIKPAPEKWSKKEILGHLMDSATNNHHRFIRAQMVDTFVLPGYEQDEWVRLQDYNTKPWYELIDLWLLYNRHITHVLRNMPESQTKTVGTVGAGEPVTLGFIAEDYLTHLKHHLAQLGVTDV